MKKVKCKLCEGTGYAEEQTLRDKIIAIIIGGIAIIIVFCVYFLIKSL